MLAKALSEERIATPSYVEIYSEAGCFGSERSSIDISTITDVQLESSGCAGACCYSDITITVVAGEADFVIAVSNREAVTELHVLNAYPRFLGEIYRWVYGVY